MSDDIVDNSLASILDHLGRRAHFCINSYAVRYLHNTPNGLSATQKERVRICAAHANHVLDWALKLRPVQKDKLRYVSEAGSIILKFIAFFIIASCQTFTNCIPNVNECLDDAKAVGMLMGDFAAVRGVENQVHEHSKLIIERAEAVRVTLEQVGKGNLENSENRIGQRSGDLM
jgi:hypothetical protein